MKESNHYPKFRLSNQRSKKYKLFINGVAVLIAIFLLTEKNNCYSEYNLIRHILVALLAFIYLTLNFFRTFQQLFLTRYFEAFAIIIFFFSLLSFLSEPDQRCYSQNSKAGEAKIQLQALYNYEVGSLADYDRFSTCMDEMESPRGYYAIGFADQNLKAFNCKGESFITPKEFLSSNPNLVINYLRKLKGSANDKTFVAYAVGNLLNTKNENELDVWSINEKKELIHVQNGTKISFEKDFKQRWKFFYK